MPNDLVFKNRDFAHFCPVLLIYSSCDDNFAYTRSTYPYSNGFKVEEYRRKTRNLYLHMFRDGARAFPLSLLRMTLPIISFLLYLGITHLFPSSNFPFWPPNVLCFVFDSIWYEHWLGHVSRCHKTLDTRGKHYVSLTFVLKFEYIFLVKIIS